MDFDFKHIGYLRTAKRWWLAALAALAFVTAEAQSFSNDDTVTVYNATATYYADKFVGRKTSSGEIFTQDKYTAAHHTIKFGTLVLVTNPKNGKEVIVKVNDRCPRRGIIDLTRKGIGAIGIKGSGKVTIRILPSSYQYAWEHQDEIRELESGRLVLTTEAETSLSSDNKKEVTDKQQKSPPTPIETVSQERQSKTAKRTETAEKKESTTRYDILLATGIARSQAERQTNKLPMHLRESVQKRPDQMSGKLKLILSLGVSEKKAKAIQRTLKQSFPNSQLIANE